MPCPVSGSRTDWGIGIRAIFGSSSPARGTTMTRKKDSAAKAIRDIHRATRRRYSAEDKDPDRAGRPARRVQHRRCLAGKKAATRTCTTAGRRSSRRPARNAWPGTGSTSTSANSDPTPCRDRHYCASNSPSDTVKLTIDPFPIPVETQVTPLPHMPGTQRLAVRRIGPA